MKRPHLYAVTIALLVAQAALAQTFSVKGVLRDPLGRTVEDGSYLLTFKLYDAETGGTEIWSETHGSVPVQHGVMSAELGTVTPLTGVSFLTTYWLGITVENHPEMSPRIKLAPTPYSLAVQGVDNRFPSTGNVGIGTATPEVKLHVTGDGTITAAFMAGKVGIGTTAPTENLTVSGNIKLADGALIFADNTSIASTASGISAGSITNNVTATITADSDEDGTGQIEFRTGTSTDMVIDNVGNVGIGTTTPASELSVTGDADITGNLGIGTTTPGPGVNLAIAGLASTIELGAGVGDKEVSAGKIGYRALSDALDIVGGGSASARRIKFWAEQGSVFTGRVGIGTDAPLSSLSFGTSGSNRMIGLFDDPGVGWYGFGIQNSAMRLQVSAGGRFAFFGGDATEVMTIRGDGNVGIGTTTPGTNLSIAGVGSAIELGAGVAKEPSAGKIGYQAFSLDALDIVGAGTAIANRKIRFFAQGGATFSGGVGVGADPAPGVDLAIGGAAATIELGAGVAKDPNSGKIGYQLFSPDALDIVGAGTTAANRKITFHASGGAHFAGPVGIGTGTPGVGLLIRGAGATIELGSGLLKNGDSGKIGYQLFTPDALDIVGAGTTVQNRRIVFHAEGGATFSGPVQAVGFVNVSDERIKNVIGTTDAAKDLATLKDLEVTDYSYIDSVGKGARTYKKLIAQQVQKVYPRAVSQSANFIPSVYQQSTSTQFDAEEGLLTVTTDKEHGFAVNDTVYFTSDDGMEMTAVRQVIDAFSFAVEGDEPVASVFVYGKKVHDFLSVDYEAVAMLNVSATQELIRRVERLEQDNAALQAQLGRYQALEAENAALKVRMDRFEAALRPPEMQQIDGERADRAQAENVRLSMVD